MAADVSFSFTTRGAAGRQQQRRRHQSGLRRRRQHRRHLQERFRRAVQPRRRDGRRDRLVGAVRRRPPTASGANVQPLAGTIAPGEYYLVALASGGAVGAVLPAANAEGDINMSATTGKVALVENSTALSGCPLPDSPRQGLRRLRTAANCREGTPNAPAPSNSTALFRRANGATDTDRNNADFTDAAPRAAPHRAVRRGRTVGGIHQSVHGLHDRAARRDDRGVVQRAS